jgi:AraC-like DNA-binding protein
MIHIFRFIHEQCRNPQFDVNHLINKLNICGTQLRELTYKHYRQSPSALIEAIRLERILEHLETGEHFMILSSKCGFGCVKTFNRVFLKRVGISAAKARKQLQESHDKEALKHQWRMEIWARGGGGGAHSSA